MLNKRDLMNVNSIMMLWSIKQNSSKRKAAESLGTSVDTITKYIYSLELFSGRKLIVNTSRGCKLTPEGEAMLERARGVITSIENVQHLRAQEGKVVGQVRVGMMTGVNSNLLNLDIAEFFDKYPELEVIAISEGQISDLDLMSYDIGITYEEPKSAGLEVAHYREVKCGFFASPKYLRNFGYPGDETDLLANHRLVNKIDHQVYSKWWKDFIKQAAHVCYSSNMTYPLAEKIFNGLGVGVMPLRFKDGGLVCLDNIACPISLKFYLVAHKATQDQPRVRVCLEYYKKLLDQM